MRSIHPQAEFEALLAEGRFMLQRSVTTGEYVFFPRVAQPGTGLDDLEWVSASGEASLYSYTIVRSRQPAEDYVIALVDLAEGVRMMSRIVDCESDAIHVGMSLAAKVGEVDGTPAVLFAPSAGYPS